MSIIDLSELERVLGVKDFLSHYKDSRCGYKIWHVQAKAPKQLLNGTMYVRTSAEVIRQLSDDIRFLDGDLRNKVRNVNVAKGTTYELARVAQLFAMHIESGETVVPPNPKNKAC